MDDDAPWDLNSIGRKKMKRLRVIRLTVDKKHIWAFFVHRTLVRMWPRCGPGGEKVRPWMYLRRI